MSGNMYKGVVTWNPLGGECIHKCSYCYMEVMRKRYGQPKWCGEPRIDEKTLKTFRAKPGSTVFVQSINDLFAENVPEELIKRIVAKTHEYSYKYGCRFLFQSRNTPKMAGWVQEPIQIQNLPRGSLIGTTIETDNPELAQGPTPPEQRTLIFPNSSVGLYRFITIEPIMRFNLQKFLRIILSAYPQRVNIGANSKGALKLPEPTAEEVLALIRELESRGIEVIQKSNLARILKGKSHA